jgi:hypothetical protein
VPGAVSPTPPRALAHSVVEPVPPTRPGVGVRVLAYVLLAGWIAITVMTILAGHRPATFGELKADAAAGRVEEVQVSGSLGPRGRGFAVVQVRWRDGLFAWETEVVEARPLRQAPRGLEADGTEVVGSVSEELREVAPGLRIATGARGSGVTWYGFDPPAAAWWILVVAFAGTTGLLAWRPEPRSATRWGWMWWVVLTPPVGPIAYLLLSGVASGRAWDRSHRRTGGGVSFFLALVVGGVLGASVGATR